MNSSTILSMHSRFAPDSPLVMNFSIPITQGGRKGGLYINPCNHNNTSIPFPRLWSAVLSCLTSQWEKHSEDDPSDRCESWDARGFGRGDVFEKFLTFLQNFQEILPSMSVFLFSISVLSKRQVVVLVVGLHMVFNWSLSAFNNPVNNLCSIITWYPSSQYLQKINICPNQTHTSQSRGFHQLRKQSFTMLQSFVWQRLVEGKKYM